MAHFWRQDFLRKWNSIRALPEDESVQEWNRIRLDARDSMKMWRDNYRRVYGCTVPSAHHLRKMPLSEGYPPEPGPPQGLSGCIRWHEASLDNYLICCGRIATILHV